MVIAVAVVLGAGPAVAVDPPNASRPNVVVVIVDDHPALDGRLERFMPEVRSLFLEGGVTFSDFHSESPLCCPARAGFLTGQHTHNHHVFSNNSRLFDPAMSIATQLDGVGYHTFLVGKYMNAYGRKSCDRPANCAPTIPPGWDKWAAFGDPAYYNYDLWVGDGGVPAAPVHYGSDVADYSTDVIARRAVELIRGTAPGSPLFAWIAPTAPHYPPTPAPRHRSTRCPVEPWTPSNWNEGDVSDKPAYVRRLRPLTQPVNLEKTCRPLLAVDELVTQVRAALEATGRLDDTLLIYSGDNGMELGEHRLPLKSAPYQTQIPFYMTWPNGLGRGVRTISERVQNIDLAPTLAELAGTTLGPFPNGQMKPDGVSMVDVLFGREATLGRTAVLDEMKRLWRGVPRWDAVTTTSLSPLAWTGCAGAPFGLCRWHYVEYPESREAELYDVSNAPCWTWSEGAAGDPCELENAVEKAAYADVKAALQEELARLRNERGHP
jgi:N-acetylglucosamine-6-sulfatase